MTKLATTLIITASLTACGKNTNEAGVDCKAIAEHVTRLVHGGAATLSKAEQGAMRPYLPALRSQIVASCNDNPKAYAGTVSTCILNANNLAKLNTCKPDLAPPPSAKPE